MALTPYSTLTNIIASLGTTVAERGLTTDQFKAKFDEAMTAFKTWFNATHLPEVDAALAAKVNLAGGTMTGQLVAQNNTNYTTAQARNITLSTASPTGGGNGDVWIQYTP